MPLLHMKKITLVILVIILLGGLRYGYVLSNSGGSGRTIESPDKRFSASAFDFHSKRFWGGTHNHYMFTVQATGGQLIQHVLMDELPQGMISWREDGLIQWAADSTSVTYSFKGIQLTLSVSP